MYLYRIENMQGIGPYRGDDQLGEELSVMHRDGDHPTLAGEFSYFDYRELQSYFCAFKSFDDLLHWFSGTFHLFPPTFHLAIFDVPRKEILFGAKQCAFQRANYTPVDTMKIHDIQLFDVN